MQKKVGKSGSAEEDDAYSTELRSVAPIKVLFVEDDQVEKEAFLRLAREQKLPYDLICAETVAEARSCFIKYQPDIILADYHLPDGYSTELFDEIKETPFILFTSTLDEQLALCMLERGADDYLPKDIRQRHLEALPFAIEKTLRRRQIREREKKLSSELQKGEQRFRAFFENAAVGAVHLDEQGRFLEVNKRFCEITGYTPAELIGQTPAMLWLKEDQETFFNEITKLEKGEQFSFDREKQYRRKDGEIIWVRIIDSRIGPANGTPAHISKIVQDITAEKNAERTLRQKEAKYRAIFEQAAIGIGRVSLAEARWIDANEALCNMLGRTPEEMRVLTYLEMTHPEDTDLDSDDFRRMSAGELKTYTIEKRFLHKSGHCIWTRLTLSLVRDSKGKPDYNIAIVEDITLRKETELALIRERAFLEAVLQASPAAIIVADASGKLVQMNPANERLWGKAPYSSSVEEYAKWKGWWADGTDKHGRPLKPHEWAMARALRGEVSPGDIVEIKPFGTTNERRIMINSGAPVRSQTGEILGAIVAQMDITALKKSEQALRESERRLRVFFESDMIGASYWTMDGKIIQANNKFLQIIGYSRNELNAGMISWCEMTPPEYRHLDEHALEELKTHGVVTPYEKEYIRKDGTRIPILLGAAMLDDNGREGVAIVLDIIHRKQAEAALRQAKDELAHTNEELEQRVRDRTESLQETVNELEHFSYTISHDMRAPLRTMQGFSELLLEQHQEHSSISKDLLKRIQVAARRMDALITDALQYSRVLRAEYPLQPINVATLIAGIIETYPNLQLHKSGIHLKGEFPLIMGNEAGLTQCFSNLLDNAIKFAEPHSSPVIQIWAEKREDWIRIWVEDNGMGIPQGVQERIWGMFMVLDKGKSGTGIGLALVRKAVQRMGGKTGVESEPGKGSRFWVQLRRADDRKDEK